MTTDFIVLLILSILILCALIAVIILLAIPRRPKGLSELERELHRELRDYNDMITDNQHDANMLQEQRFAGFERATENRLSALNNSIVSLSKNLSSTQSESMSMQDRRFSSFEQANEQKLEQIRQTMERRIVQMQQENSEKLEKMQQIPWVANASLTEAVYEDGRWTAVKIGETCYLAGIRTELPKNV